MAHLQERPRARAEQTRAEERKLKVLHLGPDVAVGGGMPAMIRDLLASPLGERHELDFIPTWRAPRPLGRLVVFARALIGLARWCAGPGTRIVHVHMASRGSVYRKGICVAVARLLRRPVVLHLHVGAADIADFQAQLGPLRRRLVRMVFAGANRVISVSRAGAEEVERSFGFGDIEVVPNPMPAVERQAPAGDPSRPAGVLYLGGFEYPAKGGRVLLEALPGIVADAPDCRVELAGPGALPAGKRLPASVGWLGWLDERAKAEAFARCEIFVLPSLSEGHPIALLEDMAAGRAIVTSRVGEVPETLSDGENGLLVAPGDHGELRRAVVRLARDPELRGRLGASAAARAEALGEEEVLPRFDELYSELAAL